MHRAFVLALSLVLAVGVSIRASAQEPGWRTIDLGSGRRATRFLPVSVRPCDPLPVVMFLHGAGGMPESYHSHLETHAEALGIVLLLPQASGAGWSSADGPTLNGALDAIDAELNVDGTRTYFAGHSAGGAYSYLLTYDGSTGVAAVFSMSAPFYRIDAVSDPAHRAPIHMYYGADDPNYTGGSATMLQAQWTRLGVTHTTDAQPGFGHSTWPASSIRAGFDFLLAQRYPGAAPPSECAGGSDAGTGSDAGAVDADRPPIDAGPAADGSAATDGSIARDAGGDASLRDPGISSGCACRAEPSRSTTLSPVLGLLALLTFVVKRRATIDARC